MKTIFFDLDGTLTNLSEFPDLRLLIPRESLEILSRDYQFGIISGSKKSEVDMAIAKLKIARFFNKNLIITADSCPESKASGVPFQVAMSKAKEISGMIGDSAGDQAGCAKIGIPFIHVTKFEPSLF